MPGTILVSVLELNGLPFQSPPSSMSMKVSMGKREYLAGDKGDFSFPLTTLRENLVIVIHDSEGNEISHGGVETKSIVERGIWDDFFSLEGGGQVHMKLQFVLNEDEKNRIRKMREAALKRKQGRPIDFRANRVQVAANAGIKLSSSVFPENAVSREVNSFLESPGLTTITKIDKVEEKRSSSAVTLAQKLDIQPNRADPPMESVRKVEARPLSSPIPSKSVSAVTSAEKLDIQPSRADPPMESARKVEARTLSSPTPSKSVSVVTSAEKLNIQPSKADSPMESARKVEARPLSSPMPSKSVSVVTSAQKLDIQPSRADPPMESVRKVEARPLSSPTPSKSVHSKQSLSLTMGPASGSSSKKRPSLERSPSSVKRMITAFESSRFQDNKPQIKATLEKQQVSKVGVYSKEKYTESKEPMESSATRVREKGVDIKPNEVEKGDVKPREDFIANAPIETSSTSETSLNQRDEQSDDASSEPGKTSIVRRTLTHESRICDEKVADIKAEEVEKDDSKPREDFIKNPPIKTYSASENSIRQHDRQSEDVSSEASKILTVRRTSTHESRKTANFHVKEIDIKLKKLLRSSASENSLHQHDEHHDVISSEPSKSSIMTRTSIHESFKTDNCPENMVNGFEVSGSWIFPDQQRLFCATTGGEKFMDLVRVHGAESETHQEKTIFGVPQKIGDDSGNQDETKRESETPKPESDDGSEPSTCIFGKVVKVAIMVGFGALVICTRQRNSSR